MFVNGWMDKENVINNNIYIHTYIYMYIYMYILFSLEKEGNTAIWDNTDEPGGHYSKWSKPDSERQTNIAWSHLYVEFKVVKLIETESWMVASRNQGRGKWRDLAKGYEASVMEVTEFWRCNACTSQWLQFTVQHCTLEIW